MAVIRCLACKLPCTEDEARSGRCPACGTSLTTEPAPAAPAVAPAAAPGPARFSRFLWAGVGATLAALAMADFNLPRQTARDAAATDETPVASVKTPPSPAAPASSSPEPETATKEPQPSNEQPRTIHPAAVKNRTEDDKPAPNVPEQVAAAPEELPVPRRVAPPGNGRLAAKEQAQLKKGRGLFEVPGDPRLDPGADIAKALEELRQLQVENLKKLQNPRLMRPGLGLGALPGVPLNPLLAKELQQLRELQLKDRPVPNRINGARELDLSGKAIDVRDLQNLRGVNVLNLSDTPIDDKGLAALKNHPQLQWLKLRNTLVTGAGLEELKGLQRLDLTGTSINDEGLKKLEGLPKLRDLELAGTAIGGSGLQNLKALVNLDLSDTPIDDKGILFLKNLKQLRSLNLKNTPVSGPGLEQLNGVQRLDLTGTLISDDGLKHLESLRTLRELNLGEKSQVSPAAIQRLQEKLPRLRVSR